MPPSVPVAEAAEIEVDRAPFIADAIYESEGRCDKLHGESGEYGCYQYQLRTWNSYSKLIAGEVLPQTEENERYITEGMIRLWLSEGKSPRWIFLTWNQGNGDGWGGGTDCYSGWNSSGVYYDSCAYADKALKILYENETRGKEAEETK